jgi:hypothetical protein
MYSELALYAATPALAEKLLPEPLKGLEEMRREIADLRNGELQSERVYIGSEMCAGQLPSPQLLREIILRMNELGLKITLALPIIWMDEVKIAQELLSILAEASSGSTEILCNDIGTIHLVAGMNAGFSPVAGRLMTKTVRDPRFGISLHPDFAPHPDVAFGAGLTSEPASSLLAALGVQRIETDVPFDMAARHLCGRGFDVSVHYPWHYVTSGRICSFKGMGKDHEKRFILGSKCSHLCREFFLRLNGDVQGVVVLHGNTILWREDESLSAPRLPVEQPVSGLRLVFNPFAITQGIN